jgi:hypothetical protein
MLTIRSEQSDALRRSALEPTREKFILILKRKLPEQTSKQSHEALHTFCDTGILKASTYGIGTEYNVYVYIATMLLLGKDFDTNPKTTWSSEILHDQRMDQDLKAKLIELRVLMDTGTDISPHGR